MTARTCRPIMFSPPMVRAIIDGAKSQTRRVMKPQPPEDCGQLEVGQYAPTIVTKYGELAPGPEVFGAYTWDGEAGWPCPFGAPGHQLWVREACHWNGGSWCYRADHLDGGAAEHVPWLSARYAPRASCRLMLELVTIRAERLQAITWLGAIAEGERDPRRAAIRVDPERGPVAWFRRHWDGLNAKRGHAWASNPWVWVLEFRRIEQPAAAGESVAR